MRRPNVQPRCELHRQQERYCFCSRDNLFNEHYQNPVGFLRSGLGVYGGVRVNN